MLLDDGVCKLYRVVSRSPAGGKPGRQMEYLCDHWYQERVVGVTRHYTAMQAGKRIERVIRIWREPRITAGDCCVDNGSQYRIEQVQHLLNEDGLQVTDLTLERQGAQYEAAPTP